MKRLMLWTTLLVLLLVVTLSWLCATSSGFNTLVSLINSVTPLYITIQKTEGSLTGGLRLTHISLTTEAITLSSGQMEVECRCDSLLSGKLHLTHLQFHDLQVDYSPLPVKTDNAKPAVLFPLDLKLDELRVDSMRFNRNGELLFDVNEIVMGLWLHGETLNGELNWQWRGHEKYIFAGNTVIKGNVDELVLDTDFNLPISANMNMVIMDVLGKLNWHGRLTAEETDLANIDTQLTSFSTALDLQMQGTQQSATAIGNVLVKQKPKQDSGLPLQQAEFNINLGVDLSDSLFQMDAILSWYDQHWIVPQLSETMPHGLHFQTGSFRIRGDQNSYQLAFNTKLQSEALAEVDITASGGGDQVHISLEEMQIKSLTNRLQANGELSWEPNLKLEFDLSGKGLDPGVYQKTWPGKLGFNGHFVMDEQHVAIEASAAGKLRALPLEARLDTEIYENKIHIKALNLAFGTARVSTRGRIGDKLDLAWQVTAPDLQVLYPQFSGELKGTLLNHDIVIDAISSSNQLHLQANGGYDKGMWNVAIAELNLDDQRLGQWQAQPGAQLIYSSDRMMIKALCLSQREARLCTTASREHSGVWELLASVEQLPLNLFRTGLLEDVSFDNSLKATVAIKGKGMEIESSQGEMQLSRGIVTVALAEMESQQFQISHGEAGYKLKRGSFDGKLRVEFDDKTIKPVSAEVSLQGLRAFDTPWSGITVHGKVIGGLTDLAFLSAVTGHLADVEGGMEVDLSVDGTLAESVLAGEFILTRGKFRAPDLGIEISKMHLEGKQQESGNYLVNGEIYSGGGNINLAAELDGVSESATMHLTLNGNDFEAINLPEIWALVTPALDMKLTKRRVALTGTVEVPRAIIDLDEVEITTPLSSDVVIADRETMAEKEKSFDLDTDMHIRFGDDVVVKGKGLKGNLTGDLSIKTGKEGELIGDGEISIKNGSYAAYGQSLEITEGLLIYNQSALDNPELQIRAIRTVDKITVGLLVSGYLTEPVVVLFSTPSMSQEEILSYIVFGRPLSNLSSGEGDDLLSAAASMGLQNSGFITGGLSSRLGLDTLTVSTNGTAQSASLLMGKYLLPNLYLSYGVGLFETLSTVRMHYDLSNSWALEAESGTETGVDLFYQIDR